MSYKNVVLYSGGLDSLVSALILKDQMEEDPILVQVDMGYNHKEINQAKRVLNLVGLDICKYVLIRGTELEIYKVGDNAFIPYRNLLLLLKIDMNLTLEDRLKEEKNYEKVHYFMGGLKEDQIADNSPRGRKKMEDIMNFMRGYGEVAVSSILEEFTKPQLVQYLKDKFGKEKTIEILKTSSSCYVGVNCGLCPACVRKFFAIEHIMDSEGIFFHKPEESEVLRQYVNRVKLGYKKSGMEVSRFLYTREVLLKKGKISWGELNELDEEDLKREFTKLKNTNNR